MRLIYHPEAEVELREAASRYQEEVSGLGARFMAEWDRMLRSAKVTLEAPCRRGRRRSQETHVERDTFT